MGNNPDLEAHGIYIPTIEEALELLTYACMANDVPGPTKVYMPKATIDFYNEQMAKKVKDIVVVENPPVIAQGELVQGSPLKANTVRYKGKAMLSMAMAFGNKIDLVEDKEASSTPPSDLVQGMFRPGDFNE